MKKCEVEGIKYIKSDLFCMYICFDDKQFHFFILFAQQAASKPNVDFGQPFADDPFKVDDGFADFARYSFSEVKSLTKTLAVLKNGVRIVNKPKESFIMEDVGYSVARDYGKHWHKVSLNAIRKAQIENHKIKVHDWFEKREFNLQEKQLIFEQFEKLDKLYPNSDKSQVV